MAESGATVVDLRTHAAYHPNYSALARNRVAMARRSLGISQADFAAELTPLVGWCVTEKMVAAWETSAVPPGDVVVAAGTVSPATSDRLGARSHKFIAAFIGPDAAVELSGRPEFAVSEGASWMPRAMAPVDMPDGVCTLHVWPFGVAVYHLVEDVDLPDLASLAMWRSRSYDDNLTWASGHLQSLTGNPDVSASYVLGLYWLHTPIWVGRTLDTALRIMCSPRILLDRDTTDAVAAQCNAERAERELLAEGFDTDGMRAFGLRGVSAAYASWSGIVYHPVDPARALAEDELVACELGAQAIWAYCDHINGRVEDGETPAVADGYGWRFLRGAQSRLGNPRPQETGQCRAMRDAIVATSGLPGHLAQAIDALRESER